MASGVEGVRRDHDAARSTATVTGMAGHSAVREGDYVPRLSLFLQLVFYSSSDNFSYWVWLECGIRSPKVLSLLIVSYVIVILSTVVIMRFYLRPTLIRSFAFPPRPLSPRTPSESSSVPTLRVTAPSDSPVTRRPGVITPKSRR